jgi:hypothetical protein
VTHSALVLRLLHAQYFRSSAVRVVRVRPSHMSSSLPPVQAKPRPLSTAESFLCGGLGACIAVRLFDIVHALEMLIVPQVTFSNPAELAKTRLQLQGELVKGGGARVYKGPLDVLSKTWRNEGLRGLQRGLGPAVSSMLPRHGRLGLTRTSMSTK